MFETDTEPTSSFVGEVVTALDRVFDSLLTAVPAEENGADIQLSFSEVHAAKQVPDEGFMAVRIRPKHVRSKEQRQLRSRERVALIARILEPNLEPLGDAARVQAVRVFSQIAERRPPAGPPCWPVRSPGREPHLKQT